jgi:hypothetical protein
MAPKQFRFILTAVGLCCLPFAFHFGCVGPEPERVEQEPEHAVLADLCNCADGCNCLKLFENGKACKCQVTNEKCCDGCKCSNPPISTPPMVEVATLGPKITLYFCPRCKAKTWMRWGKPEPAGVECGACSRLGIRQRVRHPGPDDGVQLQKKTARLSC